MGCVLGRLWRTCSGKGEGSREEGADWAEEGRTGPEVSSPGCCGRKAGVGHWLGAGLQPLLGEWSNGAHPRPCQQVFPK